MDKVRIGVIGSGAIAQVQHMPNLHELQHLFEVTWTCDVSAKLAEYLGDHRLLSGRAASCLYVFELHIVRR